ncbi:hypothetical protein FQR65_LT01848 [Abscondita terminalis]|nr:hypothetical protein FQR65_LT01848 [Abscondita terminalis]
MWHLAVFGIALFLYFLLIKPLKYWKERNVPFVKPLPLFGNVIDNVFKRKSTSELSLELYRAFPNHRYVGIYKFRQPQLMIRDLDLIRQITIKDFDHFTDRTHDFNNNLDPIFSKNLAVISGHWWKQMRSKLNPSFNSSKVKLMFNLIDICAQRTLSHFVNFSDKSCEIGDCCARFTNDSIASVAFGIEIDSMTDRENQLFVIGQKMSLLSYGMFKLMGFIICPSLMKLLKISFLPAYWSQFFTKIITDSVEERKSKNIVRHDLVQPLFEPIKDQVDCFSIEDVVAQAVIFYFAGFSSVSTTLSFICYELAVNYEVQKKLHTEIDGAIKCSNEHITYDALSNLTYLDMVITETMRLYPSCISLQRKCVKDYLISPDGEHERPLLIKKGQTLSIPLYSIHRDEKYFPNPNQFDPDRFESNKKFITSSYLYAPFGIGPRSCIASKLSMMMMKIFLYHLMSKFELFPVEQTQIPLVISKSKTALVHEGGLWLGVRTRKFYVFGYWHQKDIKSEQHYPIFGNLAPLVFKRVSLWELFKKWYTICPEKKYIGVYVFSTPKLVLRDLEVIKRIALKDFDVFADRTLKGHNQNLSNLKGQSWMNVRSTINPAFSNGNAEFMIPLISESAERVVEHLLVRHKNIANVEISDISGRYASDSILQAIFGIKINSLEDRNNGIYNTSKDVVKNGELTALQFCFTQRIPIITRFRKILKLVPKFVKHFRALTLNNLSVRRSKRMLRPNLLDLILQAADDKLSNGREFSFDAGYSVAKEALENGERTELSDELLVAQLMEFYLNGFEFTSNLICRMSHELCFAPKIQEKLQKEIDECFSRREITYRSLTSMKYLDMVVSESLRKWPPNPMIERVCLKDYKLEAKTKKKKALFIEKDTSVFIPIVGLHYDPNYFSNPDTFDPERFNEENKLKIEPFSYLPFGIGARNCIVLWTPLSTMLIIALLFLTILFLYKILYKPFQYWKEVGIPHAKGWPIFGSLWKSAFGEKAIAHVMQDSYNAFSNHRYFGFFLFNTPTLCVRDADLARKICVTDFDYFRDHRLFLPENADPFWNKIIFSRKGNDWRDMRKIIAPLFSQSKMKTMFTFISDCAQRLINNFPETEQTTIEMSDLLSKFTNDFTVNCIFGIDCDSYKQPENVFYSNGKKVFINTTLKSLKFFGVAISPFFASIFKVKFFGKNVISFIDNVINDVMEHRKENNIVRLDVLHLFKEAQKGRLKYEEEDKAAPVEFTIPQEDIDVVSTKGSPNQLTDDDIKAQIIGFLYTSYDTLSTLMCNMVYELAIHPDVQEKLIEEVDKTWLMCNHNLTYEHLTKMKYMDMVASETLRIRSPTLFIDRVVTKPYTIDPVLPNEKQLHLKPGDDITIPVYCFLHDDRYFPNPEKFDPERFNEENKHSVLPHTLLSFGIGPRSCLGSRLALLELKAVVFYFLLKFKFVPVDKTTVPFSMCKLRISQYNDKEYWLGLKPRN